MRSGWVGAVHLVAALVSDGCRTHRTPCCRLEQQATASPTPPTNRRQRRAHLQPAGTPPPPPAQPATSLPHAVLAGVQEDHRYEQYYFDAQTRKALTGLLADFERPLLLCAPSLAVALEETTPTSDYLLLDRDERFSFLRGFRRWDLADAAEVACVGDSRPDVVLCDPPFANFPLQRLRDAINVLAPRAPLYLAYNVRREEEVQRAFGGWHHPLDRLGPLGYESVKPTTQRQIVLFGPSVGDGRVALPLLENEEGGSGEVDLLRG